MLKVTALQIGYAMTFMATAKPGEICPLSGSYRMYRDTDSGLVPTPYWRTVHEGDRFPPTAGKKHLYGLW